MRITRIFPKMRLMLPSGNVIVVVGRDGRDWACEYHQMARARGVVLFSGHFLRTKCRRV
jgi:hypothetical protein